MTNTNKDIYQIIEEKKNRASLKYNVNLKCYIALNDNRLIIKSIYISQNIEVVVRENISCVLVENSEIKTDQIDDFIRDLKRAKGLAESINGLIEIAIKYGIGIVY